MQLLSTNTRVEAPVVIVEIGDVSFGFYNKQRGQVELFGKYYTANKVTYPNYIKSLQVTKINGALNNYQLVLNYAITPNDDPNLIDKILSRVSQTREITFTYGDATSPSFMYRQEKAVITQVKTTPEVANSRIVYTISAVSTALSLTAGTFSFPRRLETKPSDVIKELIDRKSYGLTDVFYGMTNKSVVNQRKLIASDDAPVTIEAQTNITILDYLKYLVSCMTSQNDPTNSLKRSTKYTLLIHDEADAEIPGPYFTINSVINSAPQDTSVDIYTIDIGYPTKDLISQFSISDDQTYAILYNYANDIKFSDTTYRIGDDGEAEAIYTSPIARDSTLLKTTAAEKTWWSQMTQYPIRATITMKGLLRAILLMSYLRVNVYYYGKKHNTSGLYIVTKQEDSISESGYTTTLSLTRVQGTEI